MLLIILSLCVYLTGVVLSARTLSRNEIKKFWRYNTIILALGIALVLIAGAMYDGFDALRFVVPQVYAVTAYPVMVSLVALIIAIRKKWEITIVCAVLGVGLGSVMFTWVFENL
ncbi:hypothetical protein [Polluticoccus soli]|uniref:hypothetical protein n=1 Tax=Polluticoccus soli TaxID=3034150 RepID=UPI0023E0B649|nr:hypothetical protein [Flavipsychrobacter sp. JY13-12]